MRIFVYEFVTGGGMWRAGGEPPTGSLLDEGRAMAQAVTSDFAQIPGVEVCSTRDARIPAFHDSRCKVVEIRDHTGGLHVETVVQDLAEMADWSLLIAPETGGHLVRLCSLISQTDSRLLSPRIELVRLASDKQETAEFLSSQGSRCPTGRLIHDDTNVPPDMFPGVVKPNDGCGSLGVQRVADRRELNSVLQHKSSPSAMRFEWFVPGIAASVAVLCGAGQPQFLPACRQYLSKDGRFAYCGGQLPLSKSLNRRAHDLAMAVVRALPGPFGYIGIDIVLGADASGQDDYVIEVNPRLTTSYVGLRALCRTNLAEAMLAVAIGEKPALSWHSGVVEFTPDGRVSTPRLTPGS